MRPTVYIYDMWPPRISNEPTGMAYRLVQKQLTGDDMHLGQSFVVNAAWPVNEPLHIAPSRPCGMRGRWFMTRLAMSCVIMISTYPPPPLPPPLTALNSGLSQCAFIWASPSFGSGYFVFVLFYVLSVKIVKIRNSAQRCECGNDKQGTTI